MGQSRDLLRVARLAEELAAPVEAWIPHTSPPRRRDLFGVGDVLAAHPRDLLADRLQDRLRRLL